MRRRWWGLCFAVGCLVIPTTSLPAQHIAPNTLACIDRDAYDHFYKRIVQGDTANLPVIASASCVRLPRSMSATVVERDGDALRVRLTENADTGGSPWWISAGSLVPGAVPDADRVVWPVIANGPRIKKGTVFCSTEQGIRQAANLMAQGDTTNLDARTPFFCANIARDDSVIEVVVRTEGIIAYKGYPRGVGSLMWVRDSDVLGLGPSAAHPPVPDSLTLVSFDVIFEKKDPGSGVFASAAVVRLTIKNNTATAVAAWRATLIVTDPFGDELFQTQLTDGRANVPPGMIADASFRFEDNPFINDEPYDKLLAYDPKKLTLRLSDVRLVH